MKGLLRNNFYSVEKNLNNMIMACFIVNLTATILVLIFPNIYFFALVVVQGQTAVFGTIAIVAMQSDIMSKWNKFEITMPVSRVDIINARYISFLLYTTIGLVISFVGTIALNLAVGEAKLDLSNFSFYFSPCFSLLYHAIAHPLLLIYGGNKISIISQIAFSMSLLICVATRIIQTVVFKGLENTMLIVFSMQIIVFMLLYVISYFISLALCKNKDIL